jgi:PhoD-like phosphatase
MTDDGGAGPRLVLGPLLRYVDETAVTIWVETDRECQVETLGRQARTFEVAGHHYALVVIDGLAPGTEAEYTVTLDGAVCWPEPGGPGRPSVLRTLDPARPLRLVFGSCRIAELPAGPRRHRARARPGPASTGPASTGPASTGPDPSHGADALAAWARDLAGQPAARWPDTLLLIGDQVYADDTGPATRQFIAGRRDPSAPPGYQVADFAEYCALYREAWTEPSVRWLLSVIPTAMIFDDHDVHDDWNISASWRREYQAKPWWPDRITAAFQSYWLYQHLGNLSPAGLAKDELWQQVTAAPGDADAVLRDFARRADQPSGGVQWSFARSFGRVRMVAIDSRAGRVLENGQRRMIGAAEWDWVTRSVAGDWDHVVLATSLPLLLPAGIHGVEAWSEAVCDGAWGKRFARAGERLRRAADLEHWAAFGASFTEFGQLLAGLATGTHGPPPASVTVISGDIHHSYLAQVSFPAGTRSRSAVYQAVCSPIHNLLPESFRRTQKLATSRAGALAGTALARLARVPRPQLGWRITRGPWFRNMLCALEFDGRAGRIRFAQASQETPAGPRLEAVCETGLS